MTGGRVKVGWKIDWALRWMMLGIDYEMFGKDLIESADISRKNLPRSEASRSGRQFLRAVPR